jgi:arabinan endo-1,5-alpha-L-arabinosidase
VAVSVRLWAQPCGDIVDVHDPCIVRCGGQYYLFSTGQGIPIRQSADRRQWRLVGEVFREPPAWAVQAVPGYGGHTWAPDLAVLAGKYHLYYSVSTFGSNRSCIGLAVNTTLNPRDPAYRWEDRGAVLCSIPGRDNWNAIDPNLVLDDDGSSWLAFGSFWSGIQLVRIDPATGKPATDPPQVSMIASRPGSAAVEAPFIVRRSGFCYLFVSFDHCCRGTESTYRIMVGRGRQLAGPYADRSGRPLLEGGGTLVLASHGECHGPGHNMVFADGDADWIVHHMYDGANAGVPTLQVRPLIWAEDGWPLAGEPVGGEASQPVAHTVATVSGRWLHSVNFGKGDEVNFLPGGTINAVHSRNTWTLDGRVLRLRWPRRDAPGGVWVDECYLDPTGQWYVGRNQRDMVIRGQRVN